jgi:hypothetical protein
VVSIKKATTYGGLSPSSITTYQGYVAMQDSTLKKPSEKVKQKHSKQWYIDRLVNRYGKDIISDLKELKTNYGITLEMVGEKHGFTREYARNAFEIVVGKAYTEYLKKKRDKVKSDMASLSCCHDPRRKVAEYKKDSYHFTGAKGELVVFQKCQDLGYEVESPCGALIDLVVNGYQVEVKTATFGHYHGSGGIYYYRFSVSQRQIDKADFIACYVIPTGLVYVIPSEYASKAIYLRVSPDPKLDYKSIKVLTWESYKEAWYLLANQTTPCSPT